MRVVKENITVNLTSIDNRIGMLETLCAECGALLTKVTIKHHCSNSTQDAAASQLMATVRRHNKNTLLPI